LAIRATQKEIAKELGISVMTVSRALNNRENVDDKTRKKVLDTAKRLGYKPNQIAKSLVLNKTYTIGVVVPEISHSFFPEVIRGIEEVTYQRQYHLILTHSAEKQKREKDAINTLESHRVDGILISTAESVKNFKLYKELINSNYPVVFFDRYVEGIGASTVGINDKESSRQITKHLIDHGYKKLAHLSGPSKVSIGLKRLEGFKEALKEANLEINEELIIESGFQESGGYKAMNKLLKLPKNKRPRAVVAVNDPAAFGAMRAIRDAGLNIPDDIAIVGFTDDIRAELLPCPLTTIRQPAYEVGKKAAKKLIDCIDGDDTVENIVVDTELIIRKSCGCK